MCFGKRQKSCALFQHFTKLCHCFGPFFFFFAKQCFGKTEDKNNYLDLLKVAPNAPLSLFRPKTVLAKFGVIPQMTVIFPAFFTTCSHMVLAENSVWQSWSKPNFSTCFTIPTGNSVAHLTCLPCLSEISVPCPGHQSVLITSASSCTARTIREPFSVPVHARLARGCRWDIRRGRQLGIHKNNLQVNFPSKIENTTTSVLF